MWFRQAVDRWAQGGVLTDPTPGTSTQIPVSNPKRRLQTGDNQGLEKSPLVLKDPSDLASVLISESQRLEAGEL